MPPHGLSLQPRHLKRYGELERLLLKYGRSDLVRSSGLEEALSDDELSTDGAAPAEAGELADDLDRRGPTYVKLGQLLFHPSRHPPPYLKALARLQDKLDAIDERTLIEGFQKVANRITVGLVLAALIVGAAMLMQVETDFRILGYPGLAMLCFLAAAGGGFVLVFNILSHDYRPKKPPRG